MAAQPSIDSARYLVATSSYRYMVEELLELRQSPLCIKPPNLPPPEEWMGPPPDTFRNQNKATNDRSKNNNENPLLDQTNRRPGLDRHASRNSANPEDIILGPPRNPFASATSLRSLGSRGDGDRVALRGDADSKVGFSLRSRGQGESADEGVNGGNGNDRGDRGDRFRDSRSSNNYRRRGDSDQDSEGWSTVKPRKSFGHEGAERFAGRMGGGDRFKEIRGLRERDSAENNSDRPRRTFDTHQSRDKDNDEGDNTRRTGFGRGRSEQWFKDSVSNNNNNNSSSNPGEDRPSQRERIDRAKSWRDRDTEVDNQRDSNRNSERIYERRWDRDRDQHQRIEREPEWLDEPAGSKAGGHTEEDFKKFMETMKNRGGQQQKPAEKESAAAESSTSEGVSDADRLSKIASTPAIELGPDRFFQNFAKTVLTTEEGGQVGEAKNEGLKAKGNKSSRFTSFFTSQEESRRQTEPPTPAAGLPPPSQLDGISFGTPKPDAAEKEAFQVLLQKLQRQTFQGGGGGTPPGISGYSEPPPSLPLPDAYRRSPVTSPEPFQQYGVERPREDPRFRVAAQGALQDILAPRPMIPSQPPTTRPEQVLQDLIGQRQLAPSQGNGRMEQSHPPPNNPQTEFLMKLMQSHRSAPEPRRTEELLMRMPQPQKQVMMPSMPDRELDGGFPREREPPLPPQRQMRPQGPPGLFDDQFHRPEPDVRAPPQPTQILQRPPPPGLDHQMHPALVLPSGARLLPHPQQQQQQQQQQPQPGPMIPPPPGLVGNPNRPMPMFPPNFPGFGPLEGVPPPRNMHLPPGFYGGPPGPPGFMPPPAMGFQSMPEAIAFPPFDARGMPPPGAGFRRQ